MVMDHISIRYAFLIVGAVIIILMSWDGLRRRRKKRYQTPVATLNLKRIKVKLTKKDLSPHVSMPSLSQDTDCILKPVFSPHGTMKMEIDVVKQMELPLNVNDDQVTEMPAEMQFMPTVSVSDVLNLSDPPASCQADQMTTVQQEQLDATCDDEHAVHERKTPVPVSGSGMQTQVDEHFVVLHVKQTTDASFFDGYHLLRVMLQHNLELGQNQFFHRYAQSNGQGNVLFSVASNETPGTFDVVNIARLQCRALIFFSNISTHEAPLEVFDEMFTTAKQVAKVLGAELQISRNKACTPDDVLKLRESLKRKYVVPVCS